jgi:hypothetical protein
MHRSAYSHIGVILVLLLFDTLWLSEVWADGVRFNSDYLYTHSDSDIKMKTTGESFNTNFTRFDQTYNLNVSRRFFPYLNFETGIIYEYNQLTSKSEDNKTDIDEQIMRPFVQLDLDSPVYNAGVAVRSRKREEKISGLPKTTADRDEISGSIGMTPAEPFPVWTLRYSHVHTYDDPETIDQIQKTLLLDTSWRPLQSLNQNLAVDYTYTRVDSEERTLDFDTLQQNHFGRIGYGRDFFKNRLSLNTVYTINYNSVEFSTESGSVETPLLRTAGLSSLDNSPEDGPALTVNNALIDGNLIASAGIDLGTNGDQTQAANIGVDLGFPQTVDQIRIWVDRELTANISGSFSWSVYTSPDNTNLSTWTLVATVSPAIFPTFDNRFEIDFPAVDTRFIKVVTRALSPAQPGAAQFPNIFVTEMQALITQTGSSGTTETSVTDQTFNLNLRGRITDRTIANYNLLYSQQDTDPANDQRKQLSNSVYLNHSFNNVFSANVNGQRNDTSVEDENTVNYTYGGAIRALWLPTFDQALTYTGRYEDNNFGTSYQNSLFLRSNAILYRGWSAFLDLGYSWEEAVSGEKITSSFIRPGTNLQPHPTLNLNLDGSFKRTEQSSLDVGPTNEYKWNVQGFYTPFSTLSLFAKVNGLYRDGDTDVYQQYTVNWSPFPDGDLQLYFTFNQVLASENNQKQTIVGPGLNWDIGRHFTLDATYNWTTDDSDIQKIESQVFNGEFKVIF